MSTRTLGCGLLLALLASVSSCTTIREILGFGLNPPKVKLKEIQMADLNQNKIKLRLRLAVNNGNDVPLKLAYLKYAIDTKEFPLGEGEVKQRIEIPAESVEDVWIPLEIQAASAVKIFMKILQNPNDDITAFISATAIFDSSLGQIEHHFKDKKSLQKIKL